MKVESFASKIKELNKNNFWIVLLISYFLLILVSAEEQFIGINVDYEGPIVLSLLCCIAFYDRYLKPTPNDRKDFYFDAPINMDISFCSYMMFHGFPVEAYFSYIMKKFLPIQITMAVWEIGVSIVEQSITKMFVGGICFVLPFLVWQMKKAMFYYNITHQKKLWISLVWVIIFTLLCVSSFTMVFKILSIGSVVGYDTIKAFFIRPDDHLVSIWFYNDSYIMLTLRLGLWPMLLFFNGRVVRKYHIRAVVLGIIMLSTIPGLYSNVANHTIIEENTIKVVRNLKETKYRFDDVEQFEIFENENEDAIAMRFYCEDGKSISVTMTNYSNTEQWDKEYDNEYVFVKDVATKLLTQGADGSIKEPEQIMKEMEEDDLEAQEREDYEKVMREIIELFQ